MHFARKHCHVFEFETAARKKNMNIRKPSIYSVLFDGLNRAMKSDATQIELYYEIARLIGKRLEK